MFQKDAVWNLLEVQMQPQIMQGIEEKLFPKKTVLLRASRDFMNFYRPCS